MCVSVSVHMFRPSVAAFAASCGKMLHHIRQKMMQKVWIAVFKVKVLVGVQFVNYNKTIKIFWTIKLWQPELVRLCIIMGWRVMLNVWIAVFKVKVTVIVFIVGECWSIAFLLNHWTLCCQTWYDDVSSLDRAVWIEWVAVFKVNVIVSMHGGGKVQEVRSYDRQIFINLGMSVDMVIIVDFDYNLLGVKVPLLFRNS